MSQIHTVTLPDIGEGVVEGEIIEWLVEIGGSFSQDQPIVVVMTDKATVELPAPYPGRLAKQYYAVGQIAIKGKPLYDIETEKDLELKQNIIEENNPLHFHEKETKQPILKPSQEKVKATPATRGLAKKLGIDIHSIEGTGSDGRVIAQDLKGSHYPQYQMIRFPSLPEDEIVPILGVRRLMMEQMSRSKHEAAHFSYFEQVDATRLVQLRQNFKVKAQSEQMNMTYVPFLIRALSLTLNKYPIVNSNVNPDTCELILHKKHNIGIAMTTAQGLIVPVLKNVETLSLEQIIRNYEKLKADALNKQLDPKDMQDSTITISNFGVLGGGGVWATPIINFPEVAILAFGKIQKQPIVKNEELVLREVLNLSWSFDHRVIDGDLAAHFSHSFAELLQNPAGLL